MKILKSIFILLVGLLGLAACAGLPFESASPDSLIDNILPKNTAGSEVVTEVSPPPEEPVSSADTENTQSTSTLSHHVSVEGDTVISTRVDQVMTEETLYTYSGDQLISIQVTIQSEEASALGASQAAYEGLGYILTDSGANYITLFAGPDTDTVMAYDRLGDREDLRSVLENMNLS